MGTGISGNYHGTYGDRSYDASSKKSAEIRKASRTHAISWAKEKAASLSKTQRSHFNTVTVAYDESTNTYYYGRNAGIEKDNHPKNSLLFGDSKTPGILPTISFNKYKIGNCAEVDAINSALNNGAKLENLHITTIHATENAMGKSKRACENCTYSFKGKVKRNYTGWYKEEK